MFAHPAVDRAGTALANGAGNPLLVMLSVDRRRFALQMRAILVTYRIERRAPSSETMARFRERAHLLLDEMDEVVALHPDLRSQIADARAEIDADDP